MKSLTGKNHEGVIGVVTREQHVVIIVERIDRQIVVLFEGSHIFDCVLTFIAIHQLLGIEVDIH